MGNKILSLVMVSSAIFFISGCSAKGNEIVDDMIALEDQGQEKDIDEDAVSPELGAFIPIEIEYEEKDYSGLEHIVVDEDISVLPSSLAYAQMSRMMYDMEPYEGRTVKIKGIYYHEVLEDLDIDRRTIMLLDEASCCQGYLEIELPEGVEYPDNGQQIMLVGIYTIQNNGQNTYPILKVTDYIF